MPQLGLPMPLVHALTPALSAPALISNLTRNPQENLSSRWVEACSPQWHLERDIVTRAELKSANLV